MRQLCHVHMEAIGLMIVTDSLCLLCEDSKKLRGGPEWRAPVHCVVWSRFDLVGRDLEECPEM